MNMISQNFQSNPMDRNMLTGATRPSVHLHHSTSPSERQAEYEAAEAELEAAKRQA